MKLNVDWTYITHWCKLVDRKKALINELSVNGIENYDWVESYNTDDWNINDIKNEYPLIFDYNPSIKRNLRHAEISLVLKHIEIIKNIIKNNYNSVLVLEDDVKFVDNFTEKFNEYIKELPDNWDICWVGSCCNLHANIIEGKHIYRENGSRCTHAFIISLNGANKILSELKYVNDCSDWFYNKVIEKFNLNNFWMEPSLIHQNRNFQSSLGHSSLYI
jgi:GR25 family glycosyltransferase involved in LPS biosynthesis